MMARKPAMPVAIVVSGAAGLSAAIFLRTLGHQVEIFEAAPHPAPLLAGFKRAGLHFDTGFHYTGWLDPGEALYLYFKAMGVLDKLSIHRAPDNFELFRIIGTAVERGGTKHVQPAWRDMVMPYGRDNLRACLQEYFPEHVDSVCNFLDYLRLASGQSAFTNPEYSGNKHFFVSERTLLESLPAGLPDELRILLLNRCELLGTPPALCALEDFAFVNATLFDSVNLIEGGGVALAAAFLSTLAELGITPRCNSKVTHIKTAMEGGSSALAGIVLENGEEIACENCIFTGHPSYLPQLLAPGALKPAFTRRLENLDETPEALLLFGTTSSSFADNRILHLHSGESMGAFLHEERFPPGTFYITGSPEKKEGVLHHKIMACRVLAPNEENLLREDAAAAKKWKTEQVELMAEQIRRCFPELADFKVLEASTPNAMRKWTYGKGSLYGAQHNLKSLPLSVMTKVRGLFLAGQSIILPGITGAVISALAASGAAHGKFLTLNDLRTWEKTK